MLWRALEWKMLVYFKAIWTILRPFDIFYVHLVYFVVNWYIFLVLVCCTEKNMAILQQPYSSVLQKNCCSEASFKSSSLVQ
jgi:hypothetical protein